MMKEQNLLRLIRPRQTETERDWDDWTLLQTQPAFCMNYDVVCPPVCATQRGTHTHTNHWGQTLRLQHTETLLSVLPLMFVFHISGAKQLQSTKDVKRSHECIIVDSSNQVNIDRNQLHWPSMCTHAMNLTLVKFLMPHQKNPCNNNLSWFVPGW